MASNASTLTFALYLILLLGIGWYAYRRTQNLSDFILGGRRLSSGVAALSASASDMSGWLLLGLPGFAYAVGLNALWMAGGLLLGTWLNWTLMAKRLRVFSEAYGDALTLPEYLANRFQDQKGWLRAISALFILFFFLLYTASGLAAGGKLFESVFDLPYSSAVALGALTILLYTTVGGFLAVSWTDVLQGLLMLLALLAVPLYAVLWIDGDSLHRLRPELLNPLIAGDGKPLGFLGIVSLLAWGLGYFGQPHILARFQAIEGSESVARARRIALLWVGLGLAGAVLAGLAGVLIIDPPLAQRERVFIVLIQLLFHPLIAGVLLAAILSAIMSTADSQLLIASAIFTEDFYRTFLRRRAGPEELVAAGRLSVVSLAGLAFLMALDPNTSVLDLVGYAWAGFGAAFGPVLLFSLYWPRMTYRGALAGILSGGLTVVLWKQLAGGIFDLYEIIPGFLIAMLAILVVSEFDRESEALSVEFDRVTLRLPPD